MHEKSLNFLSKRMFKENNCFFGIHDLYNLLNFCVFEVKEVSGQFWKIKTSTVNFVAKMFINSVFLWKCHNEWPKKRKKILKFTKSNGYRFLDLTASRNHHYHTCKQSSCLL